MQCEHEHIRVGNGDNGSENVTYISSIINCDPTQVKIVSATNLTEMKKTLRSYAYQSQTVKRAAGNAREEVKCISRRVRV